MLNVCLGRKTASLSWALILTACLSLLTACGDGKPAAGAAPVAGGGAVVVPPVLTPTLTLTLTSAAGTAVTSISSTAPVTVSAVLLNAAGAPVANQLVTFTADPLLVSMIPASGTALTNTAGVATIKISPANIATTGAANITATAQMTAAGIATPVTGMVGFSIGAVAVTVSNPVFGTGAVALSANGTTSVSVTVSSAGVPVTAAQVVNFSSPCASSGKATLSTGIATVNGIATASYLDKGCAGNDTITATVGAGLATSSSVLVVTPPVAGSLGFTSAIPMNIALQGSGGITTSQVIFTVMDSGGLPLSGQTVSFALSTTIGGITLTSPTGISNALGQVVATVNSGTVSTPVQVKASMTVAGLVISTQSSALSITTGMSDQAGFSLSATTHAIEGLIYDGATAALTIRLADHFKNPPPDGTTVTFTAEAGGIVGTCNTIAGACTSTYTSQGLRPSNGRVTVQAVAVGDETFVDINGNGVADSVAELVDINGVSTDMDEAFVDYNEDGIRQANEPFTDFNLDAAFTVKDGKFNGIYCNSALTPLICAATKTLSVRSSTVIVLSGSTATITAPAAIVLPACTPTGPGAPVTPIIKVVDVNGNAMPAGTKVDITSTAGSFAPVAYVVPDSIGCVSGVNCPAAVGTTTFGDIKFSIQSGGIFTAGIPPALGTCTLPAVRSGTMTVTVTTPKGVITKANITITD
jgi:hypothetical protein